MHGAIKRVMISWHCASVSEATACDRLAHRISMPISEKLHLILLSIFVII